MSGFDARAAWQLPLQWPNAASAGSVRRDAPKTRGLIKAAIVMAILALTVLDRFGLRVVGETSISIGMMGLYALAAALVLTGAAELNARAALAYVAVASVAALSLMVNAAFAPPPYVSKLSYLLLLLMYAPLCVSLRPAHFAPELWRWTLRLYIGLAAFVALAGIVQYFTQFVFKPSWLFDYTPLLPERMQTSHHWATVGTVEDAGRWTKSNGFFMREPSFFSILAAFGLVCELSLDKRKWVMAILAMGLVLSYSGSGLLCLGAALLFPMGRGTLARIATFAILGSAVYLLFGDALHLSYTLQRASEFTSTQSSAYCRFIHPVASALEQIDSDPWASVLGHGPGSINRMGGTCTGFETAPAKAFFEYGVAGLLAFGFLLVGALQRSAAPARIRAAVAVTWLLLTGLLSGETLLMLYLVSAMWPQGTAASAGAPTSRTRRFGRT